VHPIDHCHERLHRAGWSVGELSIATATGPAWPVTGSNGENRVAARGITQGEAWLQAMAQAQALGMLDRGCCFLLDRRCSAPDTHAHLKTKRTPAQPDIRWSKPGAHSGC
jgi:hypothetical protein